jgi:hypothetical protein
MRQTTMLTMLVIAVATTGAEGQVWNEVGDAPAGVPEHQATVGLGPLTTIIGSLDAVKDHVDTYAIEVIDPNMFMVTIGLTNGEALANARLWLWNDTTRGGPELVMANDDSPVAQNFSALLTDPSKWPGGPNGLFDSPGSIDAGGRYLLSVSYFDNNPVDDVGKGTPLANLDEVPHGLWGPNPDAGPFASWQNPGAPNVNGYEIGMRGVTFSLVPEPATLWIMIASLLLPFHAIRRQVGRK